MFILKRESLLKAGACSLEWFDKRSTDGGYTAVYPNGWDQAETDRVATENPLGLLFLLAQGLIPVTRAHVFEAIERIHTKEGFEQIKKESRERAQARIEARRAGPQQEPVPPGEFPTLEQYVASGYLAENYEENRAEWYAAKALHESPPDEFPTLEQYVAAGYSAESYESNRAEWYADKAKHEGGSPG